MAEFNFNIFIADVDNNRHGKPIDGGPICSGFGNSPMEAFEKAYLVGNHLLLNQADCSCFHVEAYSCETGLTYRFEVSY